MILNHQKGIALYITLILTSIILAIALGMSLILVGQLKMTQEIGNSTKAFYAADAGMEMALNQNIDEIVANNNGDYAFVSLDGSADYGYLVTVYASNACGATCKSITVIPLVDDCGGQFLCYKSKGTYKDITRAIEIKR